MTAKIRHDAKANTYAIGNSNLQHDTEAAMNKLIKGGATVDEAAKALLAAKRAA